ncbi:MAG: CHAD domain-containing protein [Pirellulaceae bacterium]|nr:CHAD domain-containing protein [Pirellulaceae bacterium]
MPVNLGYRILAAKYIRQQAKQLAGQLDGVCAAKDIEFVHRARVATRRLRAALEMFDDCFARKHVKRWRKAIRRTTSSLGGARDRDVQLDFLCETLAALNAKECVPGIAALLVHWEHDRQRMQPHVVAAVERLREQGTLEAMARRSKRILRMAASLADDPWTPETIERAGCHIRARMDELLEHQSSLKNQYDREEHHAMRIALKRLRYTLEISRPLYAAQLDEPIKICRKLQTLLGDIHDCDVWLENLDNFARAERDHIIASFGRTGRFRQIRPGIEYLQENRRLRRREAFDELVAFWAELSDRGFWAELAAVVGNPTARPDDDAIRKCD